MHDSLLRSRDPLRSAMWLALAFALIKLVVQVFANVWQAHLGWGYFFDEYYYIDCGRHLDWGYVDHGPIVALQARLALALFGKSLAGLRMFSAIAGAAKVFLTGVLAWQLGAGRRGQTLAMFGVLFAPVFLGIDGYLSMNSFEPVFWAAAAFALLRLVDGGGLLWGIVFGLAAGIGCENKPSMVFFLAALFVGLLVTPQRTILRSRAIVGGVVLGFLLVIPNLLWQVHHDWAMLHFLHNISKIHSHSVQAVLGLVLAQVLMLNPIGLFLWGAGVVWLLRAQAAARFRFLGWTYIFFLLLMLAQKGAKEYYFAPIYPIYFAAGGAAWDRFFQPGRLSWMIPAYSSALLAFSLLTLPLGLPVFTPQQTIAYVARMHLHSTASRVGPLGNGPFTAFFALRFGWQELTDDVTRVYDSLPASDRARAGIFCAHYSEAGAINFLGAGRGLPIAISGHNNYFLWGPQGESGEVMIVITPATRETLLQTYAEVEKVGAWNYPYAIPSPTAIYLCRGRRISLIDNWWAQKHYD